MKMSRLRPVAAFVLGSAVLTACVSPLAKPQLTIKPVTEIQHTAGASAAAYYERGTYYQTRGNLDLALEAYNDALALDNRYVEARNAMATIYSQQGNFSKAESNLREAVAQSPDAVHLRNNLGYVYYLQGNHESAVKEFREALKRDPKNEWARNNLEMAQEAITKRVSTLAESSKPAAPIASVTVTPLNIWSDVQPLNTVNQPSTSAGTRIEPEVAQASKPTPAPVLIASNEFRLEISNGSGIPGLAKRLSQLLSRLGIPVQRLTNQQPYRQIVTEIQYRDGFEREAKKLWESLNGQALLSRVDSPRRPVDIRVVLGKDIKTHMAKIGAEKFTRVAISKPGTDQLQ